jgi:transposase
VNRDIYHRPVALDVVPQASSVQIPGAAEGDLGINILASAVTSSGAWLLYRGSRAKEDFFHLTKKIAEAQSKADSAKNAGDSEEIIRLSIKKRRLFRKLARRMAHLYWNLANHLVRGLWELGVSRIYLGYPHDIAQDRGNKLTSNMWRYRELMDAIELKAQEYGIRVYEVLEYSTSTHCAIHGMKVARGPRGVVTCPLGHRLHSDLNGALNILRRGAGSMPTTLRRPLSFLVDHGGVAPVKGRNRRDPAPGSPGGPSPFRAGMGSAFAILVKLNRKSSSFALAFLRAGNNRSSSRSPACISTTNELRPGNHSSAPSLLRLQTRIEECSAIRISAMSTYGLWNAVIFT